jgi:hypothetical protein
MIVEDVVIPEIWHMGVMSPITIPSAEALMVLEFPIGVIEKPDGPDFLVLRCLSYRYAPQFCRSDPLILVIPTNENQLSSAQGKTFSDWPSISAGGEIPRACGPRTDVIK